MKPGKYAGLESALGYYFLAGAILSFTAFAK
jgi:hypothetical protein